MNAAALLLTSGGVLVILAVLLSLLWHRMDGKVDEYYNALRDLKSLRSTTPHPSIAHETEEELQRLEAFVKKNERALPLSGLVRLLGVYAMYGGTVLSALGVIIWGVMGFR